MSSLEPDETAWRVWRESAGDAAVDAALRGLYARLDAEIAERGPTCWQSGDCCKFGEYGHRLYVTGLEVAWFLGQVGGRGDGVKKTSVLPRPLPGGGERSIALAQFVPTVEVSGDLPGVGACPYQVAGRCTAHGVRPLGCRIFFCQEGTQEWQHDLYERYLHELRGLHEAHGIAYRYADWLVLLAEAGSSRDV